MDWDNYNLWYWIVLAVTGIISGILGYLFGKSDTPSISKNSEELNTLEIENSRLKHELETCQKKLHASKSKNLDSVKENVPGQIQSFTFDVDNAKAAFGKNIKENDLKLVEGIGPKIEGLFHDFSIKTWKQLSETSTDKCQEVLDSGGKRYRIHDPASWPMQAKMAYEGHWEQLMEWQEKHRSGKY